VQAVLVGEADGPVRLVRDAGGHARRLAHADLGGGDLEGRIAALGGAARAGRGHARRGGVAGEDRELVLDGLEGADGAAELPALRGVADGLGQDGLQRARHLGGTGQRAVDPHGVGREAGRGGRSGLHGSALEGEGVARLERQVAILARPQRDRS
jgi:hypothetical protein